jgi:peptide/nickel transport system substrate-binding protein
MRFAAILLACLLVPAQAAKNPDTFVYAIVGDVSTLDPHWQYDGVSAFASEQVYEGLIGYDGARTDRFIPLLASKVPSRKNGLISKDGRSYTFPIRYGVRFHNGSPLTPEDVRYSLMRSMLQDRDAGHAWMLLGPILGVQTTRKNGKPDQTLYHKAAKAITVRGNNVTIRLAKPFAPFLSILPTYGAIISKKYTAAKSGWDGKPSSWVKHNNPDKQASPLFSEANATGPFMVERWDRRGKTLVLTRNKDYWRSPANLKRVLIKTIHEFSTRRLMLQGGDADAIFLDRNFLPQVAGLPGVTVLDDLPLLETHNAFLFQFDINVKGNPYTGSGRLDGRGVPSNFFRDKDLRRAFAHAFPYDEYIRDVYRGKGRRARGPIPYGVFGYDGKTPLYTHDLAKAEEFFKKAHAGKVWRLGFKIGCIYQQGKETRGQACQILKHVLRRLNPRFQVEVHGVQWSTYLDLHRKKKLPLVNARWGLDFPDPHNPIFAFLHSEGTYAKTQGYHNPQMDSLIDAAARATIPAKRQALYKRIQRLAHDELAQIYTLDTVNFRVQRSWLKGWDYNPVLESGYLYPVSKQ